MALPILFFGVFYTKLQIAPSPSSLPHHYIFCMTSLPAPVSSVCRICILENLCSSGFSHGSRAKSLLSALPYILSTDERVTLFYAQTVRALKRALGWDFVNQTCWEGKPCEISEHPVMRFPFLLQCQLQQPSAGFSFCLSLLCMTVAKVPLEVFV